MSFQWTIAITSGEKIKKSDPQGTIGEKYTTPVCKPKLAVVSRGRGYWEENIGEKMPNESNGGGIDHIPEIAHTNSVGKQDCCYFLLTTFNRESFHHQDSRIFYFIFFRNRRYIKKNPYSYNRSSLTSG